jgi:hypothetical protein
MPFSHLAQRSSRASKRLSFIVGLIQMVLVAVNVKNMASGNVVYAMVFTVGNTLYMQYAVRTIIHSTFWERLVYALGSAAGVAIGIAVHFYLLRPHAFTQLATVVSK